MRKTYISIVNVPTYSGSETTNITLYNNNLVVFNIKQLLHNSDKKIIKLDIDWDLTRSSDIISDIIINNNFLSDFSINYNDNKIYRENMLNIIKSDINIPIISFFEHEYKMEYNNPSKTYITIIRVYYIDGTQADIRLKIQFSVFDFFDVFGGLNILNSQYILNDNNYVLLTAETATNYIVNYCLKQLANRSNVISSKRKVSSEESTLYDNQIVLWSNPSVYIATLNGDPIYIIMDDTLEEN